MPSPAPDLPPRCARIFRVEGEMGAGGFGAVYRARQVELDRPVALKVLHRDALVDEQNVARFQDEARAAAAIQHPHIVRVIDHDVEDGLPWIAFELVDGESLEARLSRGALTCHEAVQMGREVASALAAIHERGVVHRDVKPANVLRDRAGSHKLTDFGIARFTQQSHHTKTGVILGTPVYMAPEIITGGAITGAADVYALGAMLYESIRGSPPFRDDAVHRLLNMHCRTPAPALAVEGAPPALVRLVAAMLAKAPDGRPSAPDVERALAGILEGSDAAEPAAGHAAPAPRARATRSGVTRAATRPVTRPDATAAGAPARSRRVGLGIALAALAALGVAGALARRSGRVDPAPVTSPTPARAPKDVVAELNRAIVRSEERKDAAGTQALVEELTAYLAALPVVDELLAVDAGVAVLMHAPVRDAASALGIATSTALEGFSSWRFDLQMSGRFVDETLTGYKRRFFQRQRAAGRGPQLDALAKQAAGAVQQADRRARALFALRMPGLVALDVAYYLAGIREDAMPLDVLRDASYAQRMTAWTGGRPETFATHLLASYLHRGDSAHRMRTAELWRAIDLYEKELREPAATERFALGRMYLDVFDSMKNYKVDRALALQAQARWKRWVVPGDVDLTRVDQAIDKHVTRHR